MWRFALLAVVSLAGCFTDNPLRKCGSFDVHTDYAAYDYETDEETFAYDFDDGFERCRKSTFGVVVDYGTTADLSSTCTSGEGECGAIYFGVDHKQWAYTDIIYLWADFAPGPDAMVVGEELELTGGAAFLIPDPMEGPVAGAALTEATVEVLDYDDKNSDPCDGLGNHKFKLRWEVLWGTEGVQPWYRAEGEDWLDVNPSDEECGIGL